MATDTTYTCATCGGPLFWNPTTFHFSHLQLASACTALLAVPEEVVVGVILFDAEHTNTGM